ncbi:putative phage protein gp47/JayE [Pseudomonas nitritireducens]|uniref:Putative phage protein gp47/JayE n=1 Tax=Pseudomonas nitroreducens TaxID=46680 RepID=A0A7W7P165_PSENT|nr:baseplate J/gp47 family protein [Pseudomonas nitritireducens]MBB4863359.1 putative phage protein gp47/JayE [Pseudomonas nitritireducens]
MPYTRPTLSDLRGQVAADITAGLPTVDGLLRFSNMNVLGTALAGLAHLNYGYLDWIAKQAVPYTATGEFLEAWAALKKVYRKPASSAGGQATFQGTPGKLLDAGTEVVRGDSVTYTISAPATVTGAGTVVVSVLADVPGANGNTDAGSLMTLGSAVTGVASSGVVTQAITGGADQEDDESLFQRMLAAYQNTPDGGSATDYPEWARAVPGVTRAWCQPRGFGAGTVVVFVMLDDANASHDGFPQGTDGISSSDNRATVGSTATGDQLIVANSIFVEQPVTAMVYVCAPLPAITNFTITGLNSSTPTTRSAIAAAIREVFLEHGAPLNDGSMVPLSAIESAIAAISGTEGFVITSPTGNLVNVAGRLPVLGTVSFI